MIWLQKITRNKIPETVIEMWVGEILFGIVCELVGVWFVQDKLGYSIGVLLGTAFTLWSIYHMWWAIDKSLDMNEEKAGKFVGTQYGVRYGLLIMLVAILYVTGWGNAFVAFLTYLGMKMAAYIQPFIHKVLRR